STRIRPVPPTSTSRRRPPNEREIESSPAQPTLAPHRHGWRGGGAAGRARARGAGAARTRHQARRDLRRVGQLDVPEPGLPPLQPTVHGGFEALYNTLVRFELADPTTGE